MQRHGAAVVLYQKNEILIVKHKLPSRHFAGVYTIPGGETEHYDEDTENTAVREVKEETGLDVNRENICKLGHYDFTMGRKVGMEELSVDLYSCNKFGGELREGDETIPIWVKIEDFISGKYPLPYMSGDFSSGINNFLKKVMNE